MTNDAANGPVDYHQQVAFICERCRKQSEMRIVGSYEGVHGNFVELHCANCDFTNDVPERIVSQIVLGTLKMENDDTVEIVINPTELVKSQNIDAALWAKAFVQHAKKHPNLPKDEGAMISWFANAMQVCVDVTRMQYEMVNKHDYMMERILGPDWQQPRPYDPDHDPYPETRTQPEELHDQIMKNG